MPSKKLSKTLYQTLLNDIAAIYDGAMKEMAGALEDILTKARWKMGQRIVEVEQEGNIRADYGSHLIEMLSADLTRMKLKGFSARNIWNMRCVYLAFPILQNSAELTWSHYVALASIKDEQQRQSYMQKAIKEHWDFPKLKEILQEEKIALEPIGSEEKDTRLPIQNGKGGQVKIPRLAVKRGILYTYRLIEPLGSAASRDVLWLDCGFFIYREMKKPQGLDLKPGDGVTTLEKPAASLPVSGEFSLGEYALKPFEVKDVPLKSVLYTYCARVVKVIDADTITVIVNLGFGILSKQKLRLRKINAPEISTARGKKARDFVLERLKSYPWVVIKTYSTDIFDRFLVDVFYLPAGQAGLPGCDDAQRIAREGILLNQELIDEGLADLWQTVDPDELAFLN